MSYPNHREHAIALINEGGAYPCLSVRNPGHQAYQPGHCFLAAVA